MDSEADQPVVLSLDNLDLQERGFTQSGAKQLKQTIEDYSNQLIQRAIAYGNADRAPNMPAEITHEHVRASSHSMVKTFGAVPRPRWLIPCQIGEYLGTAAAGVGGGHLDKPWGIVLFALSVTVAVILFVVRLTKGKEE